MLDSPISNSNKSISDKYYTKPTESKIKEKEEIVPRIRLDISKEEGGLYLKITSLMIIQDIEFGKKKSLIKT